MAAASCSGRLARAASGTTPGQRPFRQSEPGESCGQASEQGSAGGGSRGGPRHPHPVPRLRAAMRPIRAPWSTLQLAQWASFWPRLPVLLLPAPAVWQRLGGAPGRPVGSDPPAPGANCASERAAALPLLCPAGCPRQRPPSGPRAVRAGDLEEEFKKRALGMFSDSSSGLSQERLKVRADTRRRNLSGLSARYTSGRGSASTLRLLPPFLPVAGAECFAPGRHSRRRYQQARWRRPVRPCRAAPAAGRPAAAAPRQQQPAARGRPLGHLLRSPASQPRAVPPA